MQAFLNWEQCEDPNSSVYFKDGVLCGANRMYTLPDTIPKPIFGKDCFPMMEWGTMNVQISMPPNINPPSRMLYFQEMNSEPYTVEVSGDVRFDKKHKEDFTTANDMCHALADAMKGIVMDCTIVFEVSIIQQEIFPVAVPAPLAVPAYTVAAPPPPMAFWQPMPLMAFWPMPVRGSVLPWEL